MICSWKNCGKSIELKEDFILHVKEHGEKSENNRCLWKACSIKRESKNGLLSHIDVHFDFPLFNCPHCDTGFKRIHDLKRHIQAKRCQVLKMKKKEDRKQLMSPRTSEENVLENIPESPSLDMKILSDRSSKNVIASKRIRNTTVSIRKKQRHGSSQMPTTMSLNKDVKRSKGDLYINSPPEFINVPALSLISSLLQQELLKLEGETQ
eukprot:NODE_13_length_54415_cov_0.522424.p33 type:complete len:208 gc:universal NODE_13_length_54415_cov_0.522424:24579-25202(+)